MFINKYGNINLLKHNYYSTNGTKHTDTKAKTSTRVVNKFGRVTIPKPWALKYGIKEGMRVILQQTKRGVLVKATVKETKVDVPKRHYTKRAKKGVETVNKVMDVTPVPTNDGSITFTTSGSKLIPFSTTNSVLTNKKVEAPSTVPPGPAVPIKKRKIGRPHKVFVSGTPAVVAKVKKRHVKASKAKKVVKVKTRPRKVRLLVH